MGVIYSILVGDDPRQYVGSTANLALRMRHHRWRLANGTHHCIKLRHAVKKYGIETLRVVVLETVSDVELIMREQIWLDKFWGGLFNTCPVAQSRRGAIMPAEAKKAISQSLLGNDRRRGKKHSQVDREKISAGVRLSYTRQDRKRAEGNAGHFNKFIEDIRCGRRSHPKTLSVERKIEILGHLYESKSRSATGAAFGITAGAVWHLAKMVRTALDTQFENATGITNPAKYRSAIIHPDWFEFIE